MRFKLDENLPRDAQLLLREAGHDVHTVLDEGLGGSDDLKVFETRQKEDRTLITFDLDFSDIRQYPPSSHSGIWVLRPRSQSVDNTVEMLRRALRVLETEPAKDRLWIVEPNQERIRE